MKKQKPDFYNKIGGQKRFKEMVDIFHLKVMEDAKISKYTKQTNIKEQELIFIHTSYMYIMLGFADNSEIKKVKELKKFMQISLKQWESYQEHFKETMYEVGIPMT